MAILELNLLGSFDGFLERQRLAPNTMGFKACALLAYLAVETAMKGDCRYPRTSLATLLWPHCGSDRKARNNLSQTLYKLRKEIGDHDRVDVDKVICTDRHAIWLNPSTTIQLDVTEFLQQVRSRTRTSLKRAVELYRDDFLADVALPDCEEFEGWVMLLRGTVRLNALTAMEIVADCAIKQGDLAEAEVYARSQLALERSREIAFRQLMTALALQGRRDAALAQYERCVAVLWEDLEVGPDQETVALAGQIRSGLVQDFSAPSGNITDPVVRQTTASHPRAPDGWAGLMNINPDGLALIQGYDLWFTSNATGQWRIWRLQSATASLAPFATSLNEENREHDQFVPALSPDGALVSFSAGVCFPTGRCARDLYLADIANGAVQRLTHSALDEYHPTWSPEGDLIVYHAGIARTANDPGVDYGLWTLNLSSGQSRQLTDRMDYDPVWSPSGEYIACHTMHSEQPTWAIKILRYDPGVVAVNGMRSWIAFDDNDIATSPSWINDFEIVFASQVNGKWDLFKLPVKTDKSYINPDQLTDNGWHNVYPSVFDGRLLIWQAFRHERDADEGSPTGRDAEIWVMDLADRTEAPLITGVGNLRDGFLVRHSA